MKNPVHSLLRRQLKRQFGDDLATTQAWEEFLATVDAAYRSFDDDRAMLERSLELSSQELLTTNSEMRAIFRAIPDLLFRVDHEGRILSFKAGTSDDLLIESGKMQGRRLQDIPYPGVGTRFKEKLDAVLRNQTVETMDYQLMLGGKAAHFEARLAPLEREEIIVIIRNITERKRAEEALRAEEERFRLVALATRDSVYDWDIVAGTIWRNDAYRAMFTDTGMVDANVLWWEEHIHPDDRQKVKQSFADAVINKQRVWSQEYRLLQGNGEYATLVDRGYILYDDAGQPVRMIGAMTDISERKRLEEQFLQAQKMDAIGQLAGGVAHDFNNLLTVVLGNLSMLQMRLLNPDEQVTAIADSKRAAQRAAALTRQLLTFSRQERVELKRLDLNEVVTDMLRMIQRLIGEHIEMRTSYTPGGSPVQADAGMMEQLLMNLVVNSRDAMPRGGELLIKTSDVSISAVEVSHHLQRRAGRFVRLSVADTGEGIPATSLARIFEPFYTTKEAGKGTGLGLATVFGIVKQHDGWIEVESMVGEGASFHIYLPRMDESGATDERDESEPFIMHGGTEKILLVEDEEQVRSWLHGLLQRYGYTVHVSESGVAAWQAWQQHADTIDLLVTDVVMPGGMNGRELGERFRAENPKMRVLHCSGYNTEMPNRDAIERDGIGFLAKPFDGEKFLRTVRDLLDAC